MTISLLVAAAENNAIGKNNQLLWHLPNDMKYFKNTTWGMPVIMGRKTFESLDSKWLTGRINIILTTQNHIDSSKGKFELASSIEDAIEKANATDCKEVFVIGGGEIFKEYMSRADKIYMTRVHAVLEADTYFPEIDETIWKMVSSNPFPADEKHKYAYDFQVWERRS
jgi:dihydrofolate reductase